MPTYRVGGRQEFWFYVISDSPEQAKKDAQEFVLKNGFPHDTSCGDPEITDAVEKPTLKRQSELRAELVKAEEDGKRLTNDPLATGGNFYMLSEKIKAIKKELGE